jgi:hypothetical protein
MFACTIHSAIGRRTSSSHQAKMSRFTSITELLLEQTFANTNENSFVTNKSSCHTNKSSVTTRKNSHTTNKSSVITCDISSHTSSSYSYLNNSSSYHGKNSCHHGMISVLERNSSYYVHKNYLCKRNNSLFADTIYCYCEVNSFGDTKASTT